MSPFTDTVIALYEKAPDAFDAWVFFVLFPIIVPTVLALFAKRRVMEKSRFVLSTAAHLLGWPTLLVALLVLPCCVFEIYLLPVLLDAYPLSRSLLAAPLAVTNWATQNSFWLVPLLWICWVFYASWRSKRAWHDAQK